MNRSIRIILCMVLVAAFFCGIAVCSAEENAFKTPGSIVTFGRYPQTAEGTDETPIEWIVLEYDETNHRVLLLSKYGLDVKPYNTEFTDVTWETCELRAWLNDEFLNKVFSPEEQSAILLTDVDNSAAQGLDGWASGGNNTQDRIFLLSCAEVNRYLNITIQDIDNIAARVAPTAYSIKQRALANEWIGTADGNASGLWWLRSPGYSQHDAARVEFDGSLGGDSVNDDRVCVRPALWINPGSDYFNP